MPVLVDHFAPRVERARELGVERIIVDPAVGFHYGNLTEPLERVRHQSRILSQSFRLRSLGVPVGGVGPPQLRPVRGRVPPGGGLLHGVRGAGRHAAGADPRGAPRRTDAAGARRPRASADRGSTIATTSGSPAGSQCGRTRPTSRQPAAAYIAWAAAWIGTTSRHGPRSCSRSQPTAVSWSSRPRPRPRTPGSTKSVPRTPSRSAGRPWPRSHERQHDRRRWPAAPRRGRPGGRRAGRSRPRGRRAGR